MSKTRKAVAGFFAALFLLGLGMYGAVAAIAPTRKVCVTNGSGVLKYLPAATCPSGTWGPIAFGGGVQGPKGDPGDSVFTRKLFPVTLTATVTDASVTMSGLRPYAAGLPETYGLWTTAIPEGSTFAVNPLVALPVAAGSTQRSFKVTSTGSLKAGESVTVTVWLISA